jgi:hypothetical protein
MLKGDYVSCVKGRLNETGWDEAYAGVFAGGDATKVERAVEATFRDAWRRSVSLLPKDYFPSAPFEGAPHEYDVRDGTGFVVLPADYYVLKRFMMRGWRKACFAAIEENDRSLAFQSNRFIRGNYVRPVCTVSERADRGRVLRYYSLPPGREHVIEEALYIPLAEGIEGVDSGVETGYDERLYGPLSWLNAGLVYSVFGDTGMAKVCEDRALGVI